MERYIDSRRWPRLSLTPDAAMLSRRADAVRARLAESMDSHGVYLDGTGSPSLSVHDGIALDRFVADGWLGVAESYMRGEWDADPLAEVLMAMLSQPLEESVYSKVGGGVAKVLSRFTTPQRARHAVAPGTETFCVLHDSVPDLLLEFFTGSTRAWGAAEFGAVSRTTTLEQVTVDTRGTAIRGGRSDAGSAPLIIDTTWLGAPEHADKGDIDDAQVRRVESMLDAARVGPGDRVLEFPSTGGFLAVRAARRGASVDVLCDTPVQAQAVEARARAAGVAGAIRCEVIGATIPSPRQWSGRYDAVLSVGRWEIVGEQRWALFASTIDRWLAEEGIAVIQMVVASETMSEQAREASDVARVYQWPHLHFPTVDEVRRTVVAGTGLSIAAEVYLGDHWAKTCAVWQSLFASQERQAAAAGYDTTFRRWWTFRLALSEALARRGEHDCVQFTLLPR